MIKIKFGDFIKMERSKQGLSMYRLSIIAGVSRKSIMDIENGSDTRLCMAEKLCKALNVRFIVGDKWIAIFNNHHENERSNSWIKKNYQKLECSVYGF